MPDDDLIQRYSTEVATQVHRRIVAESQRDAAQSEVAALRAAVEEVMAELARCQGGIGSESQDQTTDAASDGE